MLRRVADAGGAKQLQAAAFEPGKQMQQRDVLLGPGRQHMGFECGLGALQVVEGAAQQLGDVVQIVAAQVGAATVRRFAATRSV